jgi:hypothetical protein
MNVKQTCVPTETAETHQDHSHVLVMKDTSSVVTSVKTLMNVFQVLARVVSVSMLQVDIDVTAMMVLSLEQVETSVTTKRRVLAGLEL